MRVLFYYPLMVSLAFLSKSKLLTSFIENVVTCFPILCLQTSSCALVDDMEKTIFRKIGIDVSEWNNFQREDHTLKEKDGISECGILCSTKENCGGLTYNSDTGSFTFNTHFVIQCN